MAATPERPASDYGSAGVHADDVEAGLAGLIRHVRTTWPAGAAGLGAIKVGTGYFASVVDFGGMGIAVCTDGIGTKALIAQMTGRYDTVGIDCVAMNVNDLVCVGAEPVTLVDYIAVERAAPAMLEALGAGLAEGARLAGVSIAGGEIAEMRDVIAGAVPGAGFDLAGTAVGRVELDAVNVGAAVRPGDSIVGIASSGIHSNGLTLARRVFFETAGLAVGDTPDGLGETVGAALLRPTHIYVREALDLLASDVPVHALAHITGDGFLNLTRIEACVGMRLDALPPPPAVFSRAPAARRHRGGGDVPRLQHGHRLLRHRAGGGRGPRHRDPRRARQGVQPDRHGGRGCDAPGVDRPRRSGGPRRRRLRRGTPRNIVRCTARGARVRVAPCSAREPAGRGRPQQQ